MTHPVSGCSAKRRARPLAVLSVAVFSVGLGAGSPAQAGGLFLYEVGTEDVGLASAGYSARAQDASTVLTNPAGMTRLEGSQTLLGAQALYADVELSIGGGTSPGLGGSDGGNPIGLFPGGSAFYTNQLSPEVTVGFGVAGNFGLAVDYDDQWVGRYYVRKGVLIGASLLPSVAWRVNDKFSVGASLNAMYGMLENKVAINNITGPDGALKLDDNEWGWGGNVGLLYEFDADTRVGLTYTSEVELDFKTNAEWTGLAPGLEALLNSRGLLNAPIDLSVNVPQTAMLSIYHRFDSGLALLASAGWQDWSEFGRVEVSVDSSNPTSLTTDLPFEDTWHGAFGAQYPLSESWRMNFGIAYDSDFQKDSKVSPMLPANSAYRFGLGVQNQVSKSFQWGLSGEYAWGGSLTVNEQSAAPVALGGRGNLVGEYNNAESWFFAANFGWNF